MRTTGRFLGALALTCSALALAPSITATATAGVYHVHACNPRVSEGAYGSWVPYINHGGMTAYPKCPPRYSDWDNGLVTRHDVDPNNENATVPFLSESSWIFRAPPGTGVVGATYEHSFCAGSDFHAGLYNSDNQPIHDVRPSGCGSLLGQPATLRFGATSELRLRTVCMTDGCRVGRGLQAYATMRSIDVEVDDRVAPTVRITGGDLSVEGRWHKGTPTVEVAASDNTSVVNFLPMVDMKEKHGKPRACDLASATPCPTWSETLPVSLQSIDDGPRELVIQAKDLGGTPGYASRTILVDQTAPGRPLEFVVAGGAGWRATNKFSAAWTNPSPANGSPVRAVHFESCPVKPGGTVKCVSGRRQISRPAIEDFSLPGPGEWQVRFWLEDEAGNENRETAHEVRLAYDGDAPRAAFLDQDPEDPAELRVAVSDVTSPVTRGEIEVRREGEPTWRSLPSEFDGGVLSAFMDDEVLPSGSYELRAHVTDSAGNQRSTTALEDGQATRLTLPLRIATSLTAGRLKRVVRRAKRGKKRFRIVLSGRARVRSGLSVRLRGRLTTPGANPLPDRDLEVLELVNLPGASWHRIATTRTTTKGHFSFRAVPGPSRTLRFRYPGTAKIRGRSTDVRLMVKAVTSLRVNRRSVVNGEDVTFRGRLRRGPIPSTGKLLQLQAYSRRGWTTFATPRASVSTGRWSYRYRFASTRGRVRYRFRVRIPREASYPYETGVSRAVRVLVRGL